MQRCPTELRRRGEEGELWGDVLSRGGTSVRSRAPGHSACLGSPDAIVAPKCSCIRSPRALPRAEADKVSCRSSQTKTPILHGKRMGATRSSDRFSSVATRLTPGAHGSGLGPSALRPTLSSGLPCFTLCCSEDTANSAPDLSPSPKGMAPFSQLADCVALVSCLLSPPVWGPPRWATHFVLDSRRFLTLWEKGDEASRLP